MNPPDLSFVTRKTVDDLSFDNIFASSSIIDGSNVSCILRLKLEINQLSIGYSKVLCAPTSLARIGAENVHI